METLVKCVRVFAEANYEKDGWDYVVEAYSDEELSIIIKGANASTPEQAVLAVHAEVKERDAIREDIMATQW